MVRCSPDVSVIVATRDRGAAVLRTVQTILSNRYPFFEVVVVDQSKDRETERVMELFAGESRVRYLRTATSGVSAGRNHGIEYANADLIAITDDDCEVPVNWLREIVSAFSVDSRIGIVFGNVIPAPHDRNAGFIPGYVRDTLYLATSIREKHCVEGISACMGVRRNLWKLLRGFDRKLGSGAPLRSGAETDLTIRCLLAGFFVYETPSVEVTHHGFRNWDEGRELIWSYWYGTGAALMKQLKCRHWDVLCLLPHLALRWAFGRSRVAMTLGRRPHRTLRLAAFLNGSLAGGVSPVDKRAGHYSDLRKAATTGTAVEPPLVLRDSRRPRSRRGQE